MKALIMIILLSPLLFSIDFNYEYYSKTPFVDYVTAYRDFYDIRPIKGSDKEALFKTSVKTALFYSGNMAFVKPTPTNAVGHIYLQAYKIPWPKRNIWLLIITTDAYLGNCTPISRAIIFKDFKNWQMFDEMPHYLEEIGIRYTK